MSVVRAATNPTSASSILFTVTFSKPVTGVTSNDFVLITTGVAGASVTGVSGSSTTYTVTVNTGSGNGTIRLDVIDDDSIRDGNNHPLGGNGTGNGSYTTGEIYTIDKPWVFLLRGIHGSSYLPPDVAGNTGFGDVPLNYWSAAWIKELAAEGITGGCGNGNYCPEYPVTRDQMAIFLLRSEHGASYSPPDVGSSTGFVDVPVNEWAAAWIKQLVIEGITAGCGSGNYCPSVPVSRAQMAVFLVRTFNLP